MAGIAYLNRLELDNRLTGPVVGCCNTISVTVGYSTGCIVGMDGIVIVAVGSIDRLAAVGLMAGSRRDDDLQRVVSSPGC